MPNDLRDSKVETLLDELWKVQSDPQTGTGIPRWDWVDRLSDLSTRQLAQVATGLSGGPWTEPGAAGTLAAVRLVADLRLTEQTAELMKKLDEATTRLQFFGIGLTFLAVVVGAAQLFVALRR